MLADLGKSPQFCDSVLGPTASNGYQAAWASWCPVTHGGHEDGWEPPEGSSEMFIFGSEGEQELQKTQCETQLLGSWSVWHPLKSLFLGSHS